MKVMSLAETMIAPSTYLCIVDIVHFVENDELDVADKVCSFVQHTSQNFCRHDQTIRLRVDLHVSCENADRRSTKRGLKVSVLLVG